jgi:hypothetical protein
VLGLLECFQKGRSDAQSFRASKEDGRWWEGTLWLWWSKPEVSDVCDDRRGPSIVQLNCLRVLLRCTGMWQGEVGCNWGTKSNLRLDWCKLATLYTALMYVASCTVQCTVTLQAPFLGLECCRSATYQSRMSFVLYMGLEHFRSASISCEHLLYHIWA